MNSIIEIEKLVFPGRGLARIDGKVVFVPGMLPGERGMVEIVKDHARHADARLVELHCASPDRIEPVCPYAPNCPGCTYQHLNYAAEVCFKQSQWVNALEHNLRTDLSSVLKEPVAAPCSAGYRSRVRLHGAVQNDGTVLGYRGENHEVVDIEHCGLACEPINAALHEFRQNDENMAKAADSELLLRWTDDDGVVALLSSDYSGDSLLVHETTALGKILCPVRSFSQVNPAVADLLMKEFSTLLQKINADCAVDLYCGTGVFALLAAKAGVKNVLGVDNDEMAIGCARRNAAELELKGTEWVAAPAAGIAREAICPLAERNGLLILDPPRRGLERKVINAVTDLRPPHVLYISCAMDTMARDAQLFSRGGYTMRYGRMFDMFPRTPYFETISWWTCN